MLWSRLQSQATLSGAVCNRGYAAVVLVSATVEHHSVDAGCLGPVSNKLPDLRCLGGLVAVQRTDIGLKGRCRHQRLADGVVNNLGEHVARRARHHEAGTCGRARNLLAKAEVATLALYRLALALNCNTHGLLTRLSGLAANLLAGIADTLALVRLRLANLANVGGDFTYLLLIDSCHRELGGAFD